jgi:hypothetical protein
MTRQRVFWFHYNKPASRKARKPQLTLHWHGACHIIDNIFCGTPTYGKARKTQPFFVMQGWAHQIDIVQGKAYVH